MRKKELYNRYMETFEELRRLKTENAEIIKELEEYKKSNEQFKSQLIDNGQCSTDRETVQENICSEHKDITELNITLSAEEEYAAAAIARIVKSAVKYSSSIKHFSDSNSHDLINLILGYSESAKMEILEIVLSEELLEDKKSKIDVCENEANEYFERMINQIK